MASSSNVDTILNRLRENDASLRFLFIGPTPTSSGRRFALKSDTSLPECLRQYLVGNLSKSDLIQHLSTLCDIPDPIFIETFDFDQLFYSLTNNTSLHYLIIKDLSISDPQIVELSQWLASNPGLSTLSLRQCKISSFGGVKIAETLRTNSTLSYLDLAANSFGKEGGIAIGESLRTNSTITSLNLCYNSIEKIGAIVIGDSLRTNSTLTSLDLGANSFGKEGGIAIGESLRTNSTLTSLYLSRNSVGNESCRTIGESLRTNSTLASLNLSYNDIQKGCGMAIGEALRTNSALTSLDLSYNTVGNDGGIIIGESLRTNSTLTSLNLSSNSVGKEASIAIGESLRTNSTLACLGLSYNDIEKEGVMAIASSLSFNLSFSFLDIDGNSLLSSLTDLIKSQLQFRHALRNQFTSLFSSQLPQFNSLSILASSDERATLKELFQTFYRQYFLQSYAEYLNILSLNEITQLQDPRNDLIVELNGLLTATPLNPQAILTRLQEMIASVDELYRSPLPPLTPIPSSSSSPQHSSSSPLPSSSTSSSSPLPSPSSSSTSDIVAFVALQNQLVSLIQALLDRYPTILSQLREQEAAVKSLAFEEYSLRLSSTISPIRDNGVAQTLMNQAITKMIRSLEISLKTVQNQIRKIEEEAQLLRSILIGIPQVLPLIESRIKEAQNLRDSMAKKHEAEVVQLKNVLGRCVQSLATLYRQQIKYFEEERQSHQTNRAKCAASGLNDRVAKIDQDIADVEVQLQTPRSLLEQVTQLAAGYDVTTTPPTMSIDELRRIGAFAHFELDQSRIEFGVLIGKGGMAKVFEGSFYGTLVAIKKLSKNQDFLAVQKEVKNWCHFHHPHILQFIGYTQEGLIVMEKMDKSLADILHLQSTLLGKSPTPDEPPLLKISFDQRFRMIWCIASGLCYLHTKEMVHRDIKSLNILVRRFVEDDVRFDIKIADFGATRSLITLGQTTARIKTPRWAAPELYHAGAVTTFKSDVFAFAMVMYEILTRRLPFDGFKKEFQLVDALRNKERPSLTLDHDLGEKVNALVELMKEGWSEDPGTRPSALVLLQKLSDIQKIHNIVNNEDLIQIHNIVNNRDLVMYDESSDFEYGPADTSHPPFQ